MVMQQQQQQQAMAALAPIALAPPVNELALDAPPSQANKKQRELYIGNLAVGQVTTEMVRELFNSILGHMVPDPVTTPPVMEVKPDPTGRGAVYAVQGVSSAHGAWHGTRMGLCIHSATCACAAHYIETIVPHNISSNLHPPT